MTSTPLVAILLVLLPPVGIALLWLKPRLPVAVKGVVSAVVGLLFLAAIFGGERGVASQQADIRQNSSGVIAAPLLDPQPKTNEMIAI